MDNRFKIETRCNERIAQMKEERAKTPLISLAHPRMNQ